MTIRAHAMFTTFDPATNAVITAATVNIYNPGTVTPISATIFDKLGNTVSNPLTSDATTGLIDFYLNVAQEVDVVVSKGGFTTRTYSNVPVLDDSSLELTALLTTTGDTVYASSANSPVRLPIGSANQIMVVSGGVPAWSSSATLTGLTTSTLTISTSISQIVPGATSIAFRNNANNADNLLVLDNGNTTVRGSLAAGIGGAGVSLSTSSPPPASGVLIGGANVATSGTLSLGTTTNLLGGGASATLGTIGGSGPATAAQQAWLRIGIGNLNAWLPYWQ